MEQNNNKSIVSSVLSQIEKGKVAMKPRSHFVLKAILGLLGIVIISTVVLYLWSFLFFALESSGPSFHPEMGARGVSEFLRSLPWILFGVALLFVGILELLVRKYAFAYRRPLLYSLVSILVLAVVGSLLLRHFHTHEHLSGLVHRRGTPVLEPFYRHFDHQYEFRSPRS